MESCNKFKQLIKTAADEFKCIDKNETIRIVSHLDCDGICASSIIIKALNEENMKYSVSIVPHLDASVVEELSHEEYKVFVFSDLGSGQLKNISEKFKGKKIFILDHHMPESEECYENIVHVNPHNCGVDGSTDISGAGITYMFAKEINVKNEDMAHVALIGAIGDVQDKNGFSKLNKEIIEVAKKSGKIEVKKGLRFFGGQTKPIHKLLEYSTDPYIPGISGSESGAIQFLSQLGISPKNKDGGWQKIIHLSEEEQQKLAAAIIMKREKEDNPEDVFGDNYLLKDEKEESPLKDAKEFSTLLNACGRMNKASIGIGACIGNKNSKQKAILQLNLYKKELINALRWYNENLESENVHKEEGFVIIKAKEEIPFTVIGTVASIVSKSNYFTSRTYILSTAYTPDNNIKASLRIADKSRNTETDLRAIVQEITQKIGGEAGGHAEAAGAIIPLEKESEFLETAKELLRNKVKEEQENNKKI